MVEMKKGGVCQWRHLHQFPDLGYTGTPEIYCRAYTSVTRNSTPLAEGVGSGLIMHRRTFIKKNLSALAAGALSFPAAEAAFAVPLKKPLLPDRFLPPGYNWNRSIVDYRSLRNSIARFEKIDSGGERLYSMIGEVEFARKKLDRSIITG